MVSFTSLTSAAELAEPAQVLRVRCMISDSDVTCRERPLMIPEQIAMRLVVHGN
jgi:hypothetical protein